MKATLSLVLLFTTFSVHAKTGPFILQDVGIIGLMSHDIFAWDHKREINTENGRLDLSTIFDYDGGGKWSQGGNPKNSSNAALYSITMNLVNHYKSRLEVHGDRDLARKETVILFHRWIKATFARAFDTIPVPDGIDEMPNNIEQAALRSMHDVLPGRIKLIGRPGRTELDLTNFFQAKTQLNEAELEQELRPFDGDYDPEYKEIHIPLGPTLNLMEIDGKFIEKFSPYVQADMLAELKAIGEGQKEMEDLSYAHELYSLFGKALCNKGNPWMPDSRCGQVD